MSAYKCILHALISFSRCLNEDIEYLSTEDAFALFSSSKWKPLSGAQTSEFNIYLYERFCFY